MPRTLLIISALVAATIGAYWQVGECGFVAFDDPAYVSANPMVNQGLRAAAAEWAFTASHSGNWHPVTSLSHMLDCTLFGLNAAAHHWENVMLHVLNSVLVFLVWRRLSRATWPSAIVAALFALHPLHVESVAWISERKDVLSTAFWLMTIAAYAGWVRRPGRGRHALVFSGCALALMAKPMAVTLPFTLLLLDYWPLRRWPGRGWGALVWEKGLLFGLAAAASVVTFLVQHDARTGTFLAHVTVGMRIGNALVSYVRYLGGMLWPDALACFYPHPGWWPWWAMAGSLFVLGAVGWLAWRERERRRWLIFGWCWYLGTLVPVIGLVQVGAQSVADRYTYVPLLGIFTVVAWAGAEWIARWPSLRVPVAAAAGIALAACTVRTFQQVPVWRTPVGLIEHARSVVGDDPMLFGTMATAMSAEGRPEGESIEEFRRGHERFPENPALIYELGLAAARMGHFEEAYAYFEKGRELSPEDPEVYFHLGNTMLKEGRLDDAERHLRKSLDLYPGSSATCTVLAEVLVRQGRTAEAESALREAVAVDRWDWKAWNALGIMEAHLGRSADGMARIEHALWINPGNHDLMKNLEALRARRADPK